MCCAMPGIAWMTFLQRSCAARAAQGAESPSGGGSRRSTFYPVLKAYGWSQSRGPYEDKSPAFRTGWWPGITWLGFLVATGQGGSFHEFSSRNVRALARASDWKKRKFAVEAQGWRGRPAR